MVKRCRPGAGNFWSWFEDMRTKPELVRYESHSHRRDIAIRPIRLRTPDLSSWYISGILLPYEYCYWDVWASGSNSQPASQLKPDRKGIGPLKRDSIPSEYRYPNGPMAACPTYRPAILADVYKSHFVCQTLDARLLVPQTPLRADAPTAGGLCFQHLHLPAGSPGPPACPLRCRALSWPSRTPGALSRRRRPSA